LAQYFSSDILPIVKFPEVYVPFNVFVIQMLCFFSSNESTLSTSGLEGGSTEGEIFSFKITRASISFRISQTLPYSD
jgi:hypothetical protein